MTKKRKKILIFGLLIVLVVLVSISLYFINQFEKILYFPPITPEEWCENQPCIQIKFFSSTLILVQPTSTFIVYLLGILTIIIGIYHLKVSRMQRFVELWGLALVLWGLGALFAGTSYQAFSYEIKCAGRGSCIWTSWWEVMYLIFSVGSVDAMLLAQANLIKKEKYYRVIFLYSVINFLGYVLIVVIGSVVPIKILITFELMIVFLAPTIGYFILFNLKRLRRFKQTVDLYLLLIWVFLIIIMGAYFLYFITGITEVLWEKGIWFSENDVLHIGLIAWILYIGFIINKVTKSNIKMISK